MGGLSGHLSIVPKNKELICIVGAGGKTSALFRLAGELSAEGTRVLVTTTTAIYEPEKNQYDKMIVSASESMGLFEDIISEGITVLGKSTTPEGKLLGVSPDFLDFVYSKGVFDYIIVEGDGSKGRPLKAPAEYEPVIPSHTTKLLGIIGLDCINREVCEEYVHRPEQLCAILNCKAGDVIDADLICRLVNHELGLFKGAPADSERYLILNKADSEREIKAALEIGQKLDYKKCSLEGIIVSSMRDSSFRNLHKGGKI